MAYKFFDENNVPYKKVGKLIVAVEPNELPRLDALYERGMKNGCRDLKVVEQHQIKDYEPYCKVVSYSVFQFFSFQGLKAIWSPHTGIVDWGVVTKRFAIDFEKRGGTVFTNYGVSNIGVSGDPTYPIRLQATTKQADIHCSMLITCAGLQSDRVAHLSGCDRDPKIVPFR